MAQSKGTILIIEDEQGFRRIYKDFLESEGYSVLEADDGEKGLHMAQTEKPDLILLDVVVPSLGGFDILKRIRADQSIKDMPIIIFSVLGERETIKKGLELGANDFAVKGFYSPVEMMNKIRALLNKSDIRKHISTYLLGVHEARADAAKLQHDMGMTKLFQCPHCNLPLFLELVPDYARSDGHWFSAHFVCHECKRSF
jgi:DNA-binding response OmpR family regulator